MGRFARNFASAKVSGGGSFWKPKSGENIVRVFLFPHKVTDGDFKLGRYLPGEVAVGATVEELFVQKRSHFKTVEGPPATCGLLRTADARMIGQCTTCAHQKALYSGTAEDKKLAANLKCNVRFSCVIVDMTLDPKEWAYTVWDCAQTVMNYIVGSTESKNYNGITLFGAKGLDLFVTFNDEKGVSPMKMYSTEWSRQAPIDLTGKVSGKIPDLCARKSYVPAPFAVYIEEAEQEEKPRENPAQTQAPMAVQPATKTTKKPPVKKEKAAPAPEPVTETPVLRVGAKVTAIDPDTDKEATFTVTAMDEEGITIQTEDGGEFTCGAEDLTGIIG